MKDPYIDPATGILCNKLGITDAADLAGAEARISMIRARELAVRPIEGGFDRAHLEAIHAHLFGDVYWKRERDVRATVEKDFPEDAALLGRGR